MPASIDASGFGCAGCCKISTIGVIMLRIPVDDTFVTKVERGRVKFAERYPYEYGYMEHMARQAILPINWDRRSWEDLPKMAQLAVLDEIRDSVASYMRWTP